MPWVFPEINFMICSKACQSLPYIRIAEFADEAQIASPSSLTLEDGEIHLWWICIERFRFCVKELQQLLSDEENNRMRRFYFQKDRLRFAVSYGILRMLTGRYLNISPQLLNFRNGSNGKPELDKYLADAPFSFNLSHSHTLVVFAFSRFYNLGVDVEHIRLMPEFQEITDSYFHKNEIAAIQSVPLCQRQEAFFYCWTQKEAFVKATGEGLSRPLNSFFISQTQGGTFKIDGNGIEPNWKLMTFIPVLGYIGAVAFKD